MQRSFSSINTRLILRSQYKILQLAGCKIKDLIKELLHGHSTSKTKKRRSLLLLGIKQDNPSAQTMKQMRCASAMISKVLLYSDCFLLAMKHMRRTIQTGVKVTQPASLEVTQAASLEAPRAPAASMPPWTSWVSPQPSRTRSTPSISVTTRSSRFRT